MSLLYELTLSPVMGVIFILIMLFSGRAFRETWKAQKPGWQMRAWGYGLCAGLSFAILAFVPLELG